jgi:hypothetical protein
MGAQIVGITATSVVLDRFLSLSALYYWPALSFSLAR